MSLKIEILTNASIARNVGRPHAEAMMLALAPPSGPWQRSLRWERPPIDRRMLVIGIGLALAITALQLGGFVIGMRRLPGVPETREQNISITLFEPEMLLPIPPEPELPELKGRPSAVPVTPPQTRLQPPPPPRAESNPNAMSARIGSAGSTAAPTARLFNADGSIRLTAPVAPAAAPANPRELEKQRWAEMKLRGENPLDCQRTRFSEAFARDEALGDGVARKYLGWVGLADREAIEHRAQQRRARALDGCDPAR